MKILGLGTDYQNLFPIATNITFFCPSGACVRAYYHWPELLRARRSLVFLPQNMAVVSFVDEPRSHGNAAIVARPLHGQLCGVASTLESESSKVP